jgi:DNA topoisomerase-1
VLQLPLEPPRAARLLLIAARQAGLLVLGGEGSGNFGHAGRPGEVGGSVTVGFTAASPAERKALGIPPAWTDVRINPDPKGALQAVGRDVKGRQQYRYSAKHSEEAAAEKFERMKAFEQALPGIRREIMRDVKSLDPGTREAAAVMHLIDKTGLRIGSNSETLADKKAYGASTLERRHVSVEGDRVSFDFVGKKGVDIRKTVQDAELARDLRARSAGKGPTDRLFSASDNQTREYMNGIAKDFSPKDFRTRHATAMALELVRARSVPKTQKEFKAARKEVGERVAAYLGNTSTVALKSYIAPVVFAKWEAKK